MRSGAIEPPVGFPACAAIAAYRIHRDEHLFSTRLNDARRRQWVGIVKRLKMENLPELIFADFHQDRLPLRILRIGLFSRTHPVKHFKDSIAGQHAKRSNRRLHLKAPSGCGLIGGRAGCAQIVAIIAKKWICGEIAQGMRYGDILRFALTAENHSLPLCQSRHRCPRAQQRQHKRFDRSHLSPIRAASAAARCPPSVAKPRSFEGGTRNGGFGVVVDVERAPLTERRNECGADRISLASRARCCWPAYLQGRGMRQPSDRGIWRPSGC